jgi:hypothetical protein
LSSKLIGFVRSPANFLGSSNWQCTWNIQNFGSQLGYCLTISTFDRLKGSNYQVSISNKADFSTHTYQQDFHVAPNPRKIIQLDASGKQGSYVRIPHFNSTLTPSTASMRTLNN